ncbi:GrpE nucleotide exchange factor [Cynara cardunculus var. scolymus]|uniref:GrpE protein homolog n=2 Tax=Cynara cardunculus var. scolymus TaxID=59895 RepID=A0A103XYW3_CYNCS|nr:GrpE nucleotide exchange factor [Cynara cardunculus var. scolymus]
MVDNFERAKQQLKLETEQEKKIDASYQGIYKQFVEIMRSLHVAAVPTVGKAFDPSVHEAIAREESKEFNEGTVIEEFRRGFVLGERLLRPAMVKVSAGPGPAPGRAPKSSDEITPQGQEEQPQTADLGQR